MIYISSACIKNTDLESSIRTLASEGFQNIELSGGTNYNPNTSELLQSLKEELNLSFLCHNYFPIPESAFVINLASLDNEISELSLIHCKNALDVSKKIGAQKFGFHAGFLINIPLNQIGKKIKKNTLFNEKKAYEVFQKNISKLIEYNHKGLKLYIENNVLSSLNYNEFNNVNPFFFTCSETFEKIDFGNSYTPLLDVAHLKVSCATLGLNFKNELKYFFNKTDYIHVSDNNSKADSNLGLKENSSLHNSLKEIWNEKKTVTLEVYSGLDDIHETYNLIKQLNEK